MAAICFDGCIVNVVRDITDKGWFVNAYEAGGLSQVFVPDGLSTQDVLDAAWWAYTVVKDNLDV